MEILERNTQITPSKILQEKYDSKESPLDESGYTYKVVEKVSVEAEPNTKRGVDSII